MIKYILFELSNGTHLPILFPAVQQHIDMARTLQSVGLPVEAGFVSIYDDKLLPYGKSESLNLKCTEESVREFRSLNANSY